MVPAKHILPSKYRTGWVCKPSLYEQTWTNFDYTNTFNKFNKYNKLLLNKFNKYNKLLLKFNKNNKQRQ